MEDRPVSESMCRTQTGKILAAVGEVREMMASHIGEHRGAEKAESRWYTALRGKTAVIALVLSALGLAIASCIKILGG